MQEDHQLCGKGANREYASNDGTNVGDEVGEGFWNFSYQDLEIKLECLGEGFWDFCFFKINVSDKH